MKNKSLHFAAFAIIVLTSIVQFSLAQTAAIDKIVMLSGEEKIGQVTEIGDTFIKFIRKGETLNYTFKKSDINKIQFASGRIEFVTQSPAAGNDSPTTCRSKMRTMTTGAWWLPRRSFINSLKVVLL